MNFGGRKPHEMTMPFGVDNKTIQRQQPKGESVGHSPEGKDSYTCATASHPGIILARKRHTIRYTSSHFTAT